MRIRTKLTAVLLVVALGPVVTIAAIDLASTRTLASDLGAQARTVVTKRIASELQALVQQFAVTLDAERRHVEVMVSVQADALAAATALKSQSGDELPPIFRSADFDDADTDIPGRVEVPDKHYVVSPDGGRRLLRVSYDHPVFVPAPGVELADHEGDIRRVFAALGSFKTLYTADPDEIASQFVCFESGVQAALPGKGNYPPTYDGRARSWYAGAAERRDLYWQIPIIDAPTGQMRMTCAKPFYTPEGTLAGVTGIDVLMLSVLERVGLPDQLASDATTLLVRTEPASDPRDPDRLVIVASREYQDDLRPWEVDVELEPIMPPPDDAEDFAGFARDVARGVAGVRMMNDDSSRPHIWGYGPITEGLALVVLVPTSVIDTAVTTVRTTLRDHTAEQNRVITGATVVTCAAVILIAFLVSKTLSLPVRRLVHAVERVADGDFTARARVRSADEIGKLAAAFNDMVPRLERHVRMSRNLEIQVQSQQSLGPDRLPEIPGYEVWAQTRRRDATEPTDFLDLFEDGPARWSFAVGTATQGGIASAMVATSARSLLRSRAGEGDSPADSLFVVNRALHGDARFDEVLAAVVVSLDVESDRLITVSAGRGARVDLFDANGAHEAIAQGEGLALGADPESVYDERSRTAPGVGSVLVVRTEGAMFHEEHIAESVRAGAPAEDVGRAMLAGGGLDRDATVVVIKRVSG
ncbi:MAG: HAMP domain-containing protein [Planctomycetota bacterium]